MAGTSSDLGTQTDHEITSAMRDMVGQLPNTRDARSTGATPTLAQQPSSGGMTYGQLCESSNPEYLGDYWRACRALYAGGPRLLGDPELMKRVFPAHAREAPDVYKERVTRAFYISYAGEIIDHLLAGFAQDPIRLTAGVDDTTQQENELPEWWKDFATDVSPPGGSKQTLGNFAIDCLREAFITQTAWVLIDTPRKDPLATPPASRLDEEKSGVLDPYLVLMPSENVVDWQVDDETGELEWVLCHWRCKRRDSIQQSRNAITDRWLYWTREGWQRFELTWDPAIPPKADSVVPLVAEGSSDLDCVPFVRVQLPDGLYAMGKLESIAREHFNKRCAASWAEYKSLFAVLYEFMATEQQGAFTPNMPAIAAIQQDPRRATNQLRGQGYSQLRGEKDRAEFIGPPVAPFKEARESCAELMREMHRVMFSMALSANMDSAALQRSGQSKQKDSDQIVAILAKVGEILREGFDEILDVVAEVRKETSDVQVCGGEKFNADSITDAITDAVTLLTGVPQKSPTFLQRYLYRIYKMALGPTATDEDLADIKNELETTINVETMMMQDPSPPAPGDDDPNDKQGGRGGNRDPDADEDDDQEEDPDDDAPNTPKRMYSSR